MVWISASHLVHQKVLASFPGLQSPNAVEGLVKLLCRMTSGGRLEAWHFRWTAVLCMHGTINHTSRRPPDVSLRTSFIRPSTALGDRRPGNKAKKVLYSEKLSREKTFANWWKNKILWIKLSQIANLCRTKGHQAPKFSAISHKTVKFSPLKVSHYMVVRIIQSSKQRLKRATPPLVLCVSNKRATPPLVLCVSNTMV